MKWSSAWNSERSQPPGQLGEVVDIHAPAVAAVCERVVHRDCLQRLIVVR